MAEAAPPPVLRGLPDEIAIWEILVRLPPKALLRCRAVCRAWRRATSTRGFLLAHHARQPTLPLLNGNTFFGGDDVESLDIIPLDRRAGVPAADQLQSVARLVHASPRSDAYVMQACCDGILVLSVNHPPKYSICNPATRQYAPLPQLYGFKLLGIYPHHPTGEYRLLLCRTSVFLYAQLLPGVQDGSYVFTLGSAQPPRHIHCPTEELIQCPESIIFRGSLHWCIGNLIMAFDTVAESLRQRRSPVGPGCGHLFEIGDMLGVASVNDPETSYAATSVDMWVMQDYQDEVWTFKCRVELPVAMMREQFGKSGDYWDVLAVPWDGDVFLLVKFSDWLLQVDIDGKVVTSFRSRGLDLTNLRLKQTLIQHTFFPMLEGYVVNSSPFV